MVNTTTPIPSTRAHTTLVTVARVALAQAAADGGELPQWSLDALAAAIHPLVGSTPTVADLAGLPERHLLQVAADRQIAKAVRWEALRRLPATVAGRADVAADLLEGTGTYVDTERFAGFEAFCATLTDDEAVQVLWSVTSRPDEAWLCSGRQGAPTVFAALLQGRVLESRHLRALPDRWANPVATLWRSGASCRGGWLAAAREFPSVHRPSVVLAGLLAGETLDGPTARRLLGQVGVARTKVLAADPMLAAFASHVHQGLPLGRVSVDAARLIDASDAPPVRAIAVGLGITPADDVVPVATRLHAAGAAEITVARLVWSRPDLPAAAVREALTGWPWDAALALRHYPLTGQALVRALGRTHVDALAQWLRGGTACGAPALADVLAVLDDHHPGKVHLAQAFAGNLSADLAVELLRARPALAGVFARSGDVVCRRALVTVFADLGVEQVAALL